jgi:UDP-3-O-[3-hydroxymyristoyl] glucosamine N-acyltransferase
LTPDIREFLATLDGCILIAPTGSDLTHMGDCVVLEVKDPRLAIAKVLRFIKEEGRQRPLLQKRKVEEGVIISEWAIVDELVELGAGAIIEPFCMVEADVRIGPRSILRSGVRVHSRVTIGTDSIVGANTVIGHQGYGFVRDEPGNKTRIPHLGGVAIGSHVEIGALVTIPSGTISPTIVEDHAKIDDHVHVGHNVRVARGASVTAAVVIGGSAVIEQEAWVGINSSIRDGLRVGSNSLVGMDSSIQQNLEDNEVARAPRPNIKVRTDDGAGSIGFK